MEEVKKKLQDELDQLEEELHFKLPKEIQKAREFGDLRKTTSTRRRWNANRSCRRASRRFASA
jgi:transcription elongation GreA/GreB family factor